MESAVQQGKNKLESSLSAIEQLLQEEVSNVILRRILKEHDPDVDYSGVSKNTPNDAPEDYVNLVEALTAFYSSRSYSTLQIRADMDRFELSEEEKRAHDMTKKDALAVFKAHNKILSVNGHPINKVPKLSKPAKFNGDCIVDELIQIFRSSGNDA